MSENIIYSFIVRDISVGMDEASIKNDLMRRYAGVEKVTRMFYDKEFEKDIPGTSVQVDFSLPDDTEKIRRDGTIVIGGICRRVYAVKKPAYQRREPKPYQNSENNIKPLCEEDLINMFDEQKKYVS